MSQPLESSASTHCANCNTQLAGNFCQECGQPAHVHRSIGHIVEELLHGILHFDSKAWRTLPALIIHPGRLTREYIDGKRKRYVSPPFLFLFLNVVMFVVVFYLGNGFTDDKSFKELIKGGAANELNNTKMRIAELDQKRASLPANDPKLATIAVEIEELQQQKRDREKTIAVILGKNELENISDTSDPTQPAANKKFYEQLIDRVLTNPDLVFYKIKGTASKFAFILIPISLPFMWLLFFRRKDIVLFDHCIFSLYSLSFICLLIILVAGLAKLGLAAWAWWLFLIAPPIHMFAQLRGTYQLSIGSAFWRTLVLLFIAGFSLCVYFIVITWFSL